MPIYLCNKGHMNRSQLSATNCLRCRRNDHIRRKQALKKPWSSQYQLSPTSVRDLKIGDLLDSNQPWELNFRDTGMGPRTLDKMDVRPITSILHNNLQIVVDGATREGVVVTFDNGKWMYLTLESSGSVGTLKVAVLTLTPNAPKDVRKVLESARSYSQR
jgi:hypothetical protein